MQEPYSLAELSDIEWRLSNRLRDPEFRREFFRAELEAAVPEAFKALRERRELTQVELAEQIGTKQSGISRFEKSTDAAWQFEFLLRMAEAMDARLRVIVEASEDVLSEYEDPAPEGPSVLANDQMNSLGQHSRASLFDALVGNRNEASERGDQSSDLLSLPQGDEGNSVWSRHTKRRDRALSVSALS